MDENTKISATDKLFDVVECICKHGGKAKINTIANDLGLYKSTVHRILNGLKARGYVYQDPNDLSYGIGSNFFYVGQYFKNNYSFVSTLADSATKLGEKYGECVQISVLDPNSYSCPKQISVFRSNTANSLLSAVPSLGSISYSHCSASGKCLLAFSDESVPEQFFGCELKEFTPNTITDWNVLTQELLVTKQRGWAIDQNELEAGLTCIAVPILNKQRKAVAAISLLSAGIRFEQYDFDQLIQDLKNAALQK